MALLISDQSKPRQQVDVPDIGMEKTIEPNEELSQSKTAHVGRTSRTAALLN